MGKYSKDRQAKYNNIRLRKRDTIYIPRQESRHTLIMFEKYCLFMEKMVTRTRHYIALYLHLLPFYLQFY